MIRDKKLSEVCKELGLEYVGDDVNFYGLNLCNRFTEFDKIISYAVNEKYVESVVANRSIVALVVDPDIKHYYENALMNRNISYIISGEPERTFYELHSYLFNKTDFYDKYDFDSVIGVGCEISESAFIERGVVVGDYVRIGHNTTIKHGTIIDDNVVIGCNTVIGSEGFQAIRLSDGLITVPHVGGCHISSETVIGDNNCVCNSLFEGETYVGKRVKTDNKVHIAHNSYIEDNVTLTAGVTLCGSVTIKSGAWIAPNTSILNKVVVGKNSRTGLGSVVVRDIPEGALAFGVPARVHD